MRTVRICGEQHAIPKDREWRLRTQESDHRHHQFIVTEYRFQAEPCNYVEIREMRQDIGFGPGQPLEDEWEDQPREPLAKYLLMDPKDPDQRHLQYGGRGMDYDFAAHEKRFLAALEQPMDKNPCGDEYYYNPELNMKKTKKTRPKNNEPDPVKEAYERYSNPKTGRWTSPQYPSFEEELLIAPEPATRAYYPKGYKGHRIKEEEDMPIKFTSGQRVVFNHPRTKDTEYGTVVGRPPEMRGAKKDQLLIATDRAGHLNDKCAKYTGEGHGIIVSTGGSAMSEAMDEQWYNVPEHIGIWVSESFIHDDVKFKKGSTGRLLGTVHDNGTVDVSWNFSNPNFHGEEDGAGNERHNQWSVPASTINMCLLDTYSKEIITLWPASRVSARKERKVGDLCVVRGRSVSMLNSEDREVVLAEGTVVELLENNGGRHPTWTCRVISECADTLLNKTVNIRRDYLRDHPSPDNFYRPGEQVEIVAVVDFRKKPLQGMTGRVILSTDREGDVGIEFTEDIGAGSLDGIGREGHCIYIEASLVKSSE